MTDTTMLHNVRSANDIGLNLHRIYGVDKATLILSSLNSAYDRLIFARRHLQLLQREIPRAVQQGLETFGFLNALNSDENSEAMFSHSMYQVKMHVTDCIQHLHAVGDTLAFAIYFFVEAPKNPQLKSKNITLCSIRKLLKARLACPGTANFSKLLEKLASHEDYIYLADLSNHAKHRSIVKPVFSLDQEMLKEKYEDPMIFSTLEMSKPPLPLQNGDVMHVHAPRQILPFIKSELARIWSIYGELRLEIEEQARRTPFTAAYVAANEG